MAASVIHATLSRNNITNNNFLYYQLVAEAMSDVSNNLLPTNIQELFLPLSRVHSYGTRSSTSQNFYRKKLNLEIKKTLSQDLVPNYGMRYQPSCAHFQNTNSNLIFMHHCLIYCRLAILTCIMKQMKLLFLKSREQLTNFFVILPIKTASYCIVFPFLLRVLNASFSYLFLRKIIIFAIS